MRGRVPAGAGLALRRQFTPGMLEFAINLQLNAAHGEQEKPCFRPSRPDEIADPELPFPDPRRFRLCQRIFYALVVHRESPACRPASTGRLRKSSVLFNC